MLPSVCCARWSSPARSAVARAHPRARPPAWRCPPSSAPGRRAASTPSTPASPCCTLLYLKSEQFLDVAQLTVLTVPWYPGWYKDRACARWRRGTASLAQGRRHHPGTAISMSAPTPMTPTPNLTPGELHLRTGAWYGDRLLTVGLPPSWHVEVFTPDVGVPLT